MTILTGAEKVAKQADKAEAFKEFLATRPRTNRDDSLKLPLTRLVAEGIGKRDWTVTVTADTPYERLFETSFWSSPGVASRIKIGDEICVRDDNLRWRALLICISADPQRDFIELALIQKVDLPAPKSTLEEKEGYSTRFEGMTDKWCVYRVNDGHRMTTGLETRSAANEYIRTDLKPKKV